MADLVARARAGQRRAVARLISMVEDESPALRSMMAALGAEQDAHVIGLTGPPGVGKSTTTSALIAAFRARGAQVGVLAVDPSSPFSGGALLGDRIRMSEHADDPGVYVRSMATRGHLGGLSWATPHAIRVLAAAGCHVILVETVGVGQSEVEVAGHADTVVVLLAPGMGDAIQAAKAGILEIGDVFVVNKADREGAATTARDLGHMLALGTGSGARESAAQWRPPVLSTVAVRGDGVPELVEALAAHREHARGSGELEQRRRARAAAEVEAIVISTVRRRVAGLGGDVAALAGEVAAGRLDPYSAADRVLAGLSTASVHPDG